LQGRSIAGRLIDGILGGVRRELAARKGLSVVLERGWQDDQVLGHAGHGIVTTDKRTREQAWTLSLVDVGLAKEHFVASAFGDERVGSLERNAGRTSGLGTPPGLS